MADELPPRWHSNYRDVAEFHGKFNIDHYYTSGHTPHLIDDPSLQQFRIKFMEEELREYKEAVAEGDLPKAADSLIDLAYVVFGTAHIHHLPWQALWDEVQRANMTKERCEIEHAFVPPPAGLGDPTYTKGCYHRQEDSLCGQPRHKHSVRGNINDVIKPLGWTAPDIVGLLRMFGWKDPKAETCRDCSGTGRINAYTGDLNCDTCNGTGQVKLA